MSSRSRNGRPSSRRENTLWERYMHLYTGENRRRPPGSPPNSREDFKSQNSKRTFAIRLSDGECLYVNPYFFETMSAVFRKQFEEIKDPYGEVVYEDLSVHDVHLLLSSVCPDLYHLYPTPIIMSYLPILLPLAKRLEMPKLLLCCEKVLEEDLKSGSNGTEKLLTSFNYAFKFGFSLELQARLLQRILKGRFPEDMADESLFYERSGHVLTLAHVQNLKKKFTHTGLTQVIYSNIEDRDVGNDQYSVQKCFNCTETIKDGWDNSRRKQKFICNAVVSCSVCEHGFCPQCLKVPCEVKLVEFLKKYNAPPLEPEEVQ
uniref:BTB domain-containing protein n=1 Tax=Syphacia muris TaxID=451379 RepID=A0A0N5AHT2_9BILA